MGSSSSRMGTSRSSGSSSRLGRTKHRLSSLFCGGTTSQSPSEFEEYPQKSPISSLENLPPVSDESWSSIAETSIFGSETGVTSSKTESGDSSEISDGTIDHASVEYGLRNAESNSHETCLSNSKESVSCQVSSDCLSKDAYLDKGSNTASTSYKEQPYQDSVSANTRISLVAGVGAYDSVFEGASINCLEDTNTSSAAREGADLCAEGDFAENSVAAVIASSSSNSGSHCIDPHPVVSLQLAGDDTTRLASPSGSEHLVSDTEQDLRTGDLHHVDVVSISSNLLSSSINEISNREARRNSRRLFWDALSRRSFRRYSDSPTIVFTTDHADDLGSHDRWFLDLSGDLHYDGIGRDSVYPGFRSHRRNERRWQLRSQISERVLGGLGEEARQTAFCSSGLHPEGTCSCDSFDMAAESSALASISRIVMLAEALFEVLDEIHRQPLSLSMLNLPAPESVVNSFPLKNHKKLDAAESGPNDVPQCYICLAEYEEGDKLRVLPCHHEYHMSCVDKWLKEINGVCPLCRSNVCEGASQNSIPNTETPSQ
ncbi:unnamed protein product [Ilex paraguariensis]|uniref:RING-type domain-containing protein n=1 Tax=Ilex paraguariensis TaxID=185542 RepID=A0ABC8TS17_9AQUA